MSFLNETGLSRFMDKAKLAFAPLSHNHDSLYYRESEVDDKLDGKANKSHEHKAEDVTSGTLDSARLPVVPISKGGTGAETAAAALNNLISRGYSSTTDWNTFGVGVYQVGQSTAFSTTYNQPVGAYPYGTLYVTNNSSNISQIYIAHQKGQMWFRERFSSSNDFTAWAMTYTTQTKPTPNDIGAISAVNANGFYGMGLPDGTTSTWIRTTSLGIIPYQSGSNSALGTSTWRFSQAYIDTVYGNLSGNALTASNADKAYVTSLPRIEQDADIVGQRQTAQWIEYAGTSMNLPAAKYYHVFTGNSIDAQYNTQLALPMTGVQSLSFRNRQGGVWQSWRTMLDSYNYSSYALPLSGGTLTGNLNVTKVLNNGKTFYNLTSIDSHDTYDEFIIKTKIPYINSNEMPVINIEGYAYGNQCPINLTIVLYILNGVFNSCSVTSTGGWKPAVYLSSYTASDGGNYIAISLVKSVYFARFKVDMIDIWGEDRDYGSGWSITQNKSSNGSIIPSANKIQVPYVSINSNVTSATTASKLDTSAGASLTPVYFSDGKPVACAMTAPGKRHECIPLICSDGVMEIGKYLDFHTASNGTNDYDFRLTANSDGLYASGTIHGNLSGNATTATNATNAYKLHELVPDTAASNSTIAARTANGYLFATHFNQSSGAETPTTSSYLMYCNSDGYLRKSSLANIKSILGLGSAAYTNSGAYATAGHTHNNATTSAPGLMSAADKSKLDTFGDIITITKTLTVTTDWLDTGITGSNSNMSSGTYVVQVSGMNSNATSMYLEIFSGVMSWYNGTTNSTEADEIVLHNAGHAPNNNTIYLRVLRVSGGGHCKLQIAANKAFTSSSYTFKFRKLI